MCEYEEKDFKTLFDKEYLTNYKTKFKELQNQLLKVNYDINYQPEPTKVKNPNNPFGEDNYKYERRFEFKGEKCLFDLTPNITLVTSILGKIKDNYLYFVFEVGAENKQADIDNEINNYKKSLETVICYQNMEIRGE